jgi:glycine cleavage system T protein (aminomethyltransferase)
VASDAQILRRTALYDRHVAAGARLTPFAGWEMPVRYGSIGEEHLAVRGACGVFDVSHMGEIETTGRQAVDFLTHVLSNDPRTMAVGNSLYAALCTPQGGVIDDAITYRLGDERFLTVTNASNHETDFVWFTEQAAGFDVEVADVAGDYAMLAVQGPLAREIVQAFADAPLPARRHAAQRLLLGRPVLVCGTGYTGEDGVELLLDPEVAPPIWTELLDAGVVPCGLGARDTLRLEVCFPLHGNELGPDRNPIEAGLGWCCATKQAGFLGSEAIDRARREGTAEKLAPFLIEGAGIPRDGNPVLLGGETVGVVTSGTYAPSLELGAGMAYVRADLAEPGTELEIDVRGKRRAARIASKPLYRKDD